MNSYSIKCDIPEHDLEDILGLCFDKNCFQKPQFCYLCKTEGKHRNHQSNCQRFEELKKILIKIKNTFIEQRKDLLNQLQIVTQCCTDLLSLTYQKKIDDCDKLITITQQEQIQESIEQLDVLKLYKNFDREKIRIFILQIQEICIGFKDKIDSLIRNNEIFIQQEKPLIYSENSNYNKLNQKDPPILPQSILLSESWISNENAKVVKNNEHIDNFDSKQEYEKQQNDRMNEDDDTVLNLQIQMIQEQEQEIQFQMMLKSDQLTEQAKQNSNNPQMAMQLIDEAILLFQNNEEALLFKAKFLYDQDKFAESIQNLDKCIQLNPQFWQAYSLYADCLWRLDKLEESNKFYQKAIEINPNESSLYSNRGNVLDMLGYYKEAIASCDKAIELNPENATAYNNKAYALQRQNKFQDALNNYDKALQLNSLCFDYLFNKGYLLIKMNKIDEAFVCLNQMEYLPEKPPRFFDLKGTLLSKKGKFQEANETCDIGLGFYPNDSQLLSLKYQLKLNAKNYIR